MKNKFKKALSFVLVTIILCSAIPFGGLTAFAAEETYSGTCGDNLIWTLDTQTGELVISGTGKMINYGNYIIDNGVGTIIVDNGSAPWINEGYYFVNSVIIKDGVTTIGSEAFKGCSNLKSVTLPDTLTHITFDAFDYCTSLTDVYYNGTEEDWNKIIIGQYNEPLLNATIHFSVPEENPSGSCGNNLTWTFYESTGELSITGIGTMYDYDYGDLRPWEKYIFSIKSIVANSGVTNIGENAFSDCTSLTSVTIPDSVTTIGDGAFYNCTGLANITVDSNNQYYSSDSYGVLYNKNKTELIKYPTGNQRTSFAIPDSVITIGEDSFWDCDTLTNVTIPNSVTIIENYALAGCDALTSVIIPDSVTTIGEGAFSWSSRLTNVTISNTVTSIGEFMFLYCENLTSITIGNSVTVIGYCAFSDCYNLSGVYYNGTEDEWNNISIDEGNEYLLNATIHFLGDDECSHSYSHIVVPSTCKVQGMEYDLCTECGDVINSKVLPLAPHTWGEWEITKEPTVEAEGEETRTCSVCGDVESREIPKLEVIKDEETGVEIVYGDEYESGVEIQVSPVFDGNSYQIIESVYDDVNAKIFDISTTKDGEKVQPDGKVKVRIPVPADFKGDKIFVCYVDSVNGTVENIPATIKNGYIEFEAEHFSYYAVMEKLGKVNSVDIGNISMNYKDSTTIRPEINVDEGVEYTVTYSSSDPSVATVDENGNVYASGKGDATITCTVTDEYGNVVADTCDVEVKYSFGQWLIIILLFGWIWYI